MRAINISRIGEKGFAKNGEEITIIEYRNSNDIDVQFQDGTIVKNWSYENFKNKTVLKRNRRKRKSNSRIGKTNIANNGQLMTIIEYKGAKDITVQFEDGTTVKNRTYDSFLKGCIKNPHKCKSADYHIGESTIAANGQKLTIIAYRNANDIDVQFEDGTIIKNVKYYNYSIGYIQNPNNRTIRKPKIPPKTERIGEKKYANNGQLMTIIDYKSTNNLTVKFEDETVVEHRRYIDFQRGNIKNPNCYPYIGETSINKLGQKMKIIWFSGYYINIVFENGEKINNVSYKDFVNGNLYSHKQEK